MNFMKRFSDRSSVAHSVILSTGEVEEAVHVMQKPGKIDLSGLTFHAFPYDVAPNGFGHTVVDIAIFPLPNGCDDHRCDLSKLGVGKREEFDGISFLSLCHKGRLRIEKDIYKGQHASIEVPMEGPMRKHVKYGQFVAKFGGRNYEVLIANCDESGRKVSVEGQVLFDFSHDDSLHFKSTPVPAYPLLSISVFLFFTLCFVRVRFTTRAAYEEARYQSTDIVELIETA
jgi:hypothetical protein